MKIIFTILLFIISLHSFSQSWKELKDSADYYYYTLDQFEKAEPFYIQANEIKKKTLGENHPDYIYDLNRLGSKYFKRGEFEKAEPLFFKVMQSHKLSGKEDDDYASSLNNLALLYERMGKYEKVEPLYLLAIAIKKKIVGENDPGYAIGLNNLAILYFSLGQYEKAEPLYLQAKEIRRKTLGENNWDYANSLGNLAILYEKIGQFEKAEQLYFQSKEIKKNTVGENHADYALLLNNIGSLYNKTGHYEKAEPLFLQAIEIWKNNLGEKDPDYAMCLANLALLYERTDRYAAAENLYIQALGIRKKILGENHPDYALNLNDMAGLYSQMRQYKKAEALYIQAIDIRKKILGPAHPEYAASLSNLAALYEKMKLYEKAEPLLLQNSKIILENMQKSFSILSEREKGEYISNNISSLEINNSFVYNYKKASPQILLNNLDQQLIFKSLTLSDTRNLLLSLEKASDTTLKRLLKDWKESKSVLANQYSLPISDRRKDIKDIETNSETLEKELNRRSAAFRNQQQSSQINIRDVKKNIEKDEAIIEFVSFRLYDNRKTDSTIYAAYILRKNDLVPAFIPLFEEKQLQRLFDSAGNDATSMVSSFYRGFEVKNNNVASSGKDLYKLIWQPLEPFLKGIKKISYSPAGKLYSIAFHALQIDSAVVLIDKYNLQQYTSTRQVALRNTEKNVKPVNITLFGDANFSMDSLQLVKQRTASVDTSSSVLVYLSSTRSINNKLWATLPGTATEVKTINDLFDKNKLIAKTFSQSLASEENLKALTNYSPQILHIATHGFFLPAPDKSKKNINQENIYTLANDPLLRSGLILAGANYAWSGKTPIDGVEDGIATAYEISQLNLSTTELVVLSACETALGDVKGSEGVFGLQRAFKMAGVKKMIVSLWQVPDKETAELMTSFYSYWMKGKTINDSFTQAQADMRKKYSPFYWAAFVLVE